MTASDMFNLLADPRRADGSAVARALRVMRTHLGMEVAYVSEFVDDRSVFRVVDAPGQERLIQVGQSHAITEVYCGHILAGHLPQMIPDTSAEPLAMSLPITQAVPIGAHVSVPICRPDGTVFGMFCCLGFQANDSLNSRDLQMMKAFAELAAFDINQEHEGQRAHQERHDRVRDVIASRRLDMVFQPIWDLGTREPVGLEALCRFPGVPLRSPDVWFREATAVGLGVALELAAIGRALAILKQLRGTRSYLALNASPQTIMSGELTDLLQGQPADQIVLEITEHSLVSDYESLLAALAPLRRTGIRLAVDDAGAGYSSLQHILQLQPDLIKLDMSLVRHIDLDPGRRALATAMVRFADDTGSQIIAEGVETAAELAVLMRLGVQRAQGYSLGRPMAIDRAIELFRNRPLWNEAAAS